MSSNPDVANTAKPFIPAKPKTVLQEVYENKDGRGVWEDKRKLAHWHPLLEEMAFYKLKACFLHDRIQVVTKENESTVE